MTYQQTMDVTFERDKNLKALGITMVVMALLLLLFVFYKWNKTIPPEPVKDDFVQIELPMIEEDIPPPPSEGAGMVGEPGGAPASGKTDNIDQPASAPQSSAPVDAPQTQNNDAGTPSATNPRLNKPVVNAPAAPTPKPKGVMAPISTGNDPGNGKELNSYNKNNGEGPGRGTGPSKGNGPGAGGVELSGTIRGRGHTIPDLTDDFNENAKVAVNITVNADGKVISAVVKPLGTTTTNQKIKNIAVKKALMFKFVKSDNETESGTIVFTFKVSA